MSHTYLAWVRIRCHTSEISKAGGSSVGGISCLAFAFAAPAIHVLPLCERARAWRQNHRFPPYLRVHAWRQNCTVYAFVCTPGCPDIQYLALDYDWSQLHFKGICTDDTMEGEHYTDYLKSEYYDNNSDNIIHRPTKFDGSDYKLDDLSDKERVILVTAIDTLIKFLNNDPEYVWYYFVQRSLVVVAPGNLISSTPSYLLSDSIPTVMIQSKLQHHTVGLADFNIQGCTLHQLLNLSVDKDKSTTPLLDKKQRVLANNWSNY